MAKTSKFFTIRCMVLAILLNCTVAAFTQLSNKPSVSVVQTPAATGQVSTRPGDYSGTVMLNYVRIWDATGAYQSATDLLNAGYQHSKQTTKYLDGLGRPLQTVVKQISPGVHDLVTPVVYDEFGRETFKYLPYVQSSTNNNTGTFKTNAFNEQNSFYIGDNQYAGEQAFYNRTEFEASPLDRPLKTFAAGNSWAGSYNPSNPGSEKAIKTEYRVNTLTDAVKIWSITSNTLNYDGDALTNIPTAATNPYPQGELYKTVTLDEQGSAVVEYKDKQGKIILKKVQSGTVASDYSGYAGFLSTYYIYDDLDQLRFVIPPKAVTAIQFNWTLASDITKELCFRYEYDTRGRMIAKKVPGSGWVYMIYDTRDRLVFTQDANMRENNQWLTTLYDALNRPVLTGMMVYTGGSPNTLQIAVNTQTQTPSSPNTSTPIDIILNAAGTTGTYQALSSILMEDGFETGTPEFTAEIISGTSGPDGETTVIEGMPVNKNPIPSGADFTALTKTYYDNYGWTNQTYNTTWNSLLDVSTNLHAENLPSQASLRVKGMTTGTKTRVIEDPASLSTGPWLTTVNFYDEKARVVQTQSDIYGGGSDIVTSRYNFSGKALTAYHVRNIPGFDELRIKTNMVYDFAGRLLETLKTINDESTKTALLAKNEYDELDQLRTKELGRKKNASGVYTSDPIETLNFSYNIRGWLKGINKNFANSTTVNDNTRWFGMELNYDWGFASNQYNGNIGGMKWRSRGDDKKRAFGFSYDKVSRFLEADFSQYNGSNYIDDNIVKFDVRMGNGTEGTAYDENGNIKIMQQWGLKLGSSEMVDNLTYNYFTNSNKLGSVGEATATDHKLGDFTDKNTSGNDYGYDKNGNLITDLNKRIGSAGATGIDPTSAGAIKYNHLNLPWQIQVKNDNGTEKGTATYIYDATGIKRQKMVVEKDASVTYNGTTSNMDITTTTYYLGNDVYESKVYEDETVNVALGYVRKLQFVGHEEGRVRAQYGNTGNPSLITGFVYDYMVKDHLSNVRMILTEEQKQDIYPAATLEGDINTAGSPNAVNIEKAYYQIDAAKIKDQPPSLTTNYTNENAAFPNPNPSSSTSSNSAKMYELKAGSSAAAMGLGITLKVMAGDRIDITGRSYWNTSTSGAGPDVAPVVLDLLSGFLGSPTGATSGTHATASDLNNLTSVHDPLDLFLDDPTRTNSSYATRPRASINYVFVDEQFKYDKGGFSPVNNTAGLKTDADHLAQLQNLVANKNGYVYIYCSNESQVSVFFDNLQVSHTRSALLEETHYYPFGLTMAGISSKVLKFGEPENKKKFVSQEFDQELGLDYYQFRYRTYDPQIGRFIETDPLASEYEYNGTYVYAENDVIRAIDVEGLEKLLVTNGRVNHHIKAENSLIMDRSYLMNSSNTSYSEKSLVPGIMELFDIFSDTKIGDMNFNKGITETNISRTSEVLNIEGKGNFLATTTITNITEVKLDPYAKDGVSSISQTTTTAVSYSKIVNDDPKNNQISVSLDKKDNWVGSTTTTKTEMDLSKRFSTNLSQLSGNLEKKVLNAVKENAAKLNNTQNNLDQAQKDFK